MGRLTNTAGKFESNQLVYWGGVGLVGTVLGLLAIQWWWGLVSHYPQLNLMKLVIGSMLAIIIASLELEIKNQTNSWPCSLTWVIIILLSLGVYWFNTLSGVVVSIIVISATLFFYWLSYKLLYLLRRLSCRLKREGVKIAKNYKWNIAAFSYLQRLLIIVNGTVVISWLLKQKINLKMILLTGALFFLQFILLTICFYQEKRIIWLVNNRKLQSNLLSRLISLVLIVSGLVVVLLLLLLGYNFGLWVWLKNKIGSSFGNIELIANLDFIRFNQKTLEDQQLAGGFKNQFWQVSWVFLIVMSGALLSTIAGGIGLVKAGSKLVWKFVKHGSNRLSQLYNLLNKFYKWASNLFIKGRRLVAGSLPGGQSEAEESRAKLKETINSGQSLASLDWQPETYREQIVALFIRSRDLFNHHQLYQTETETLQEYLSQVRKQLLSTTPQLMRIEELVNEAIYSDHQVTQIQVKRMRSAVKTVEKIYGTEE